MFSNVPVAAISFRPEKFNLQENVDRLEQRFEQAADGGAQLAVAPEGILEGYVVSEILVGRAPAESMNDVALTMRSPLIRRFRNLAIKRGICLAFGLAERCENGVFNCAVFIDHKGRTRGKYHKMQLAEGYCDTWWFNRLGKRSRAFSTPFGRAGFLICNDRWNEDIARIPVLDGARYLLIPSYGDRSRAQDQAVLSRARENGVPIVEANVGVTMIVSKGEIVAVSRKIDSITFGDISIPATSSQSNRNRHENTFLDWRKKEMPKRYRNHMKASRKDKKKRDLVSEIPVKHDSKGRLLFQM